MPGGLMNLIAYGNQNIILNGTPTKSFFKASYVKYTNFGLQKFRINHEGQRQLDLTKETHYTFKMPRYGDLLMDTYLVMRLPHIWSPLYKRTSEESEFYTYIPYEFKWIEEIGTHMIKEIRIHCGNTTLQQYSGEYINICAKRDNSRAKLDAFDEMTGNTPLINNPALPTKQINNSLIGSPVVGYPSAFFDTTSLSGGGPEPSIRGRHLYIPIGSWFCNSSKQAFPMVASQYNELYIDITMRPIKELFVIRDVSNSYQGSQNSLSYITGDNYTFSDESLAFYKTLDFDSPKERKLYIDNLPYIQPNFNLSEHAMYRFLHPPPNSDFDYTNADKRTDFNSDIHLISTYGFLTEEENRQIAKDEHSFLIKDVREYTFHDLVGTQKVELESTGLISNWTFFLRRSDANIRNQWNNYINWPYKYVKPQLNIERETARDILSSNNQLYDISLIGPNAMTSTDFNYIESPLRLYSSGSFNIQNERRILKKFGIQLDGKVRESDFQSGLYDYIDPFMRTSGGYEEGLHVYNFGLKTDPSTIQPNGAINLSKYSRIELEIETEIPPLDPDAEFNTVCAAMDTTTSINDTVSGAQILGVNKETFRLYKYTYDMRIFEEKYNIVNFVGGHCGLMFSR